MYGVWCFFIDIFSRMTSQETISHVGISQLCIFPSGNFPQVREGHRLQLGAESCGQMGQGAERCCQNRLGEPSAASRTDLGSCCWGNCTFGKFPLGKIPFEKAPYVRVQRTKYSVLCTIQYLGICTSISSMETGECRIQRRQLRKLPTLGTFFSRLNIQSFSSFITMD